ncbi:excisionase [Adhaeribacter aerolatus]|uniref:Excisionase n=1 Tax=Adhaeribacter aerolatus TaxID=670289 RepID=A0A512AUI4_9BACT|nr:helix-turn-helix domain-containing protein [Adhaeribacter aerolatus]GEO03372.1 excisionase [Adhaeribacter aerolatus]
MFTKNPTFEELPKAVSLLLVKLDHIEQLLLQNTSNSNSVSEQPLSVQEAAKFLNLAVPTVYTLVSQQILPYSKKSKRLYFSKQDLTEWIQSGRKKTISEIQAEATAYLPTKKRRG